MRAIAGQLGNWRAWSPFLVVVVVKALGLCAIGRFDLVPWFVVSPLLALLPQVERHVHYPDLLLQLPWFAHLADLGLFVTAGVVAQALSIRALARNWSAPPVAPLRPGRAWLRAAFAVVAVAVLLLLVPMATVRLARWMGAGHLAATAAMLAGGVASLLLFTAPVFALLHGMSFARSVRASINMVAHLPIALPLAVVGIAVLHLPGLVLRTPAIRAGAAQDPDWILGALLGQLPAEFLGAFLAAGIATYVVLRTRVRTPQGFVPIVRASTVALAVLALGILTGCGDDARPLTRRDRDARRLLQRFDAERWVERARLREADLDDAEVSADSTAWLQVAELYTEGLRRLGPDRVGDPGTTPLERDLGRLACRAVLGRAAAMAQAGHLAAARREYRQLLERSAFRGASGDGALGLARAEDRGGDWTAAAAGYEDWLRGVQDGVWPLHANGIAVPAYVARRWRDRGDAAARVAWVDLAVASFEAAAVRGEQARDARTVRFALLLDAGRWDEAHAALSELRQAHDPGGRDAGLLVAEASLLAGGMQRDQDALGILQGLSAERSAFEGEHRVTGWLLAGQIHFRAGHLDAALDAYEQAANAARSDAGRSEAALGLARVYVARGALDDARRYYTQLRKAFPSSAAGLVAPLEEIRVLRQHGQAEEAQALVAVAMQGYRAVIQQFGTEGPALIAARFMSECFGLEGDWERGVAFLDSISGSFGSDPRAGSLLVRAARLSAEKMTDRPRAQSLLTSVAVRYPGSDIAVRAQALSDSLSTAMALP